MPQTKRDKKESADRSRQRAQQRQREAEIGPQQLVCRCVDANNKPSAVWTADGRCGRCGKTVTA